MLMPLKIWEGDTQSFPSSLIATITAGCWSQTNDWESWETGVYQNDDTFIAPEKSAAANLNRITHLSAKFVFFLNTKKCEV